jgi:hypothetical protein
LPLVDVIGEIEESAAHFLDSYIVQFQVIDIVCPSDMLEIESHFGTEVLAH